MTKSELVDCAIDSYNDDVDPAERARTHAVILMRAEELSKETYSVLNNLLLKFDKIDKAAADADRKINAIKQSEINLTRDKRGEVATTIENFFSIMLNDPHYSNIHFNLLSNQPEIHVDGVPRLWSDADLAASRNYIESRYRIHSESKHRDALRLLFREREYHPIRDIVDNLKWDGVERVEHFLAEWAKVEDNEYTREVSRLIFAGGINRLYSPGCKFDDVPVLIGTNQGEGKSSLVRWLAINDSFYSEVTEFEGQRGIEQLEGAWICEVAELLALTKTKEQEAVKSYITRQRDKYRRPYAENIDEQPRRCVFIGSTNKEEFLRDKTGNRRWYPVKVHSSGYWLYEHEQECRDYILQCWAEARVKFERGEMPNYANPKFLNLYQEAQENAMEDDWRVGAIIGYLDRFNVGECVCVRQIAHEALSPSLENPRDPNKAESNEITQIMSKIPGWVKSKKVKRLGKYGVQKYWQKTAESNLSASEILF